MVDWNRQPFSSWRWTFSVYPNVDMDTPKKRKPDCLAHLARFVKTIWIQMIVLWRFFFRYFRTKLGFLVFFLLFFVVKIWFAPPPFNSRLVTGALSASPGSTTTSTSYPTHPVGWPMESQLFDRALQGDIRRDGWKNERDRGPWNDLKYTPGN